MLMHQMLRSLPVIALALFGLSSALQTTLAEKRISAIQSGLVVADVSAAHILERSTVDHPREWITLASVLSSNGPDYDPVSIALLERALEADPNHPNVWSLLAFLRARRSNEFTESAAAALREANQRCTLCNRAELQWRLTFTLKNWDQMPEDLRMSAFVGADFLRWWYLEYDYLGQVRESAKVMGIPFDAYRRKVGTPVRPNEIP